MMPTPSDRHYAVTHEWIRTEDDVIVVGITDTAQDRLGDLVFVGDVKVGARLAAGDPAGVVESVKTASDIHAPVTGVVIAFNDALSDNPGLLNESPYETWIFKMRAENPDDSAGWLDAAGYEESAGIP
jgi:glycine cleavage system H protein